MAVLPFVSRMSGEAEQEYFSDGISEDLITALSKLRWFFVIARNSSFIYKGSSAALDQVAAELGVCYVVEGSVRKSGDRVRITAQLNDVASGSHLWAERHDRELADVFAVQDEIIEAIVAAIELQLYAAENFRDNASRPTTWMPGIWVMRVLSHCWRVTRQDHVVAQALLEKATEIDPGDGPALGVLSASYVFSAHMVWIDMPEAIAKAERGCSLDAVTRADGEDPWAHYALGYVYLPAASPLWSQFARGIRVWRCGSIPTSHWRRVFTDWPFLLLRALAGGRHGRAARDASQSLRDPFRRFTAGSMPTRCLLAVTMMRRCACRGKPSDCGVISLARIGS